jgi:hypothetical protein
MAVSAYFRTVGNLQDTSTELADLKVGTPEMCTARCADEGLVEIIVPIASTGLADTARRGSPRAEASPGRPSGRRRS